MNEVRITTNGKGRWKSREFTRQLPAGWSDVPLKLRQPVLKALLLPGHRGKVEALFLLLKIPKWVFFSLPPVVVADLLKYLKWLNKLTVTEPLLPSFQHRRRTYFMPKAKLENGKAIEYPMADDFYNEYLESGDREKLVMLLATLAREKGVGSTLSDPRCKLTSREEVVARANRLDDIPDEILQACLMYFAGVKEYIHQIYGAYLFERPVDPDEDEEDEFFKSIEESQPSFGWWGRFLDIAEAGVFGDYPAVLQTNFHTICIYLVQQKVRNDELRRQLERSTNQIGK